MPLTRDVLHRALHWGAVAVIAAVGMWSIWQQSVTPTRYPPGLMGWVTVVGVSGLAWCVVDAVRNNPRRTGLRVWVGLTVALGLVQAVGRFPAEGLDLTPPLIILMASGYAVAGFAFDLRIGMFVAWVSTVIFLVARWDTMDNLLVFATSMTVLAGATTAALVIDRLRRAATEVEGAVARAWRDREQASREQAAADAQQEWDGLVHDKVLGALLLAGRSKSAVEREAARELAQDALGALDRDEALAGATSAGASAAGADAAGRGAEVTGTAHELELLAHATRVSARLGLGLRWIGPDTTGPLRADRAAALREATEQAITNVARHAGVASVAVTLRVENDAVVVLVADRGGGFDVTADRGRHRGIEQGIEGRVARVGGVALVESATGAGTTVTIRMPVEPLSGDRPTASGDLGGGIAAVDSPTVTWRDSAFFPVYRMAGLSMSAQAFGALRMADEVRSLPLLLGCLWVVIVALAIVAFAPRRHQWLGAAASLAATPVPFVGTLNMFDPSRSGWAYWFVGAMTAVIAGVAFRWDRRWSAVLMLAVVVGIPAAHLVRLGHVELGPIADACPQAVAFFFAGWAVRESLDNAAASIATASADTGLARVLLASAEEARGVAAARIHELGYAVNDQLRRIASADVLSEAEQRECLALESRARDVLVAGPMLTPDLIEAVARCRADGIRVVLSAERGEAGGIRVFVAHLLDALATAGPGAVVRALWRPDGKGRLGSISVVGGMPFPDVPSSEDLNEGVAVEISRDDEALLLTFTRPELSA